MKKIMFVFPTSWDAKQLENCRPAWAGEYEVLFSEPSDIDCAWNFEVPAFIREMAAKYRGQLHGVTSSSDYPGATAAAGIARELALPGASPQAVLRASHKYYSRLAQREAVPRATPQFHLVDPAQPDGGVNAFEFPCFIKPVKGAFSIMSQKLTSREDLRAFLARPEVREFAGAYVHIFNQLVRHYTDFQIDGSYFLIEEFLNGMQVTVEGFSCQGQVEIMGIVDSVMYPGSGSFARFDYPSMLPAEIQAEMAEIARRVIGHLQLDNSLFNIEMIYHPANDDIYIIEINPRICGQFADLYHKVDGYSTYQVALALAAGQQPAITRGAGAYRVASSFPWRVFEPSVVRAAPDASTIRAAEALFPETLVWSECETGQQLADFTQEDGNSARYAVINLGGHSRRDLRERLEKVRECLGYRFEKIG